MCGIYGRIRPYYNSPDEAFEEMAAARRGHMSLKHRGPDGSGFWQKGGTTLAHSRLSIIDLSERAAQPMTSESGKIVTVYNGEIYNYPELRRELENFGHRFKSSTDTEVLIHGYEQWGVDLLGRLDGMFSFGVWDDDRRVVFLARDPTGKKPLFLHLSQGKELTFASEIKAIAASGVETRLRKRSIVDFLVYGYVPSPHTFYEDVFQLPPAHFVRTTIADLCSEGMKFQRYWDVSFSESPEMHNLSVEEAAQVVRELVETAVEKRLVADVPVGAFLSGGLDSTIIAGVMSRKTSGQIRTFSMGFETGDNYDETRYARLASRAFATDHTEFRMTSGTFETVEKLVLAHDGPFADSSAIPTAVLSRCAREHVSVVLTGDGGDEVFAGYDRFLAACWAERLPHLLKQGLFLMRGLIPVSGQRTLAGRTGRFLEGLPLGLPERVLRWLPYFAYDIESLCRPELLGSQIENLTAEGLLGANDLFAHQYDVFNYTKGQSTLARLLDHNFRTYLPQDLLVKTDRCTMSNSLEARSPFLDKQLVEKCASLPDHYKMCCGISKLILRRAFRDIVPKAILGRRKMGFGIPVDEWFRTCWKENTSDYLLDPKALINDYLNHETVVRYFEEHTNHKAHRGHQLFSLLTLEIWLRNQCVPLPAWMDV